MFFRRSILDKATVLDKTRFVVQRAIMESNCLIDTELTLSATRANKLRLVTEWILGLKERTQQAQAHSSATVMKKLSVPKLHDFTVAFHLYEFSISSVL